jgi:hypothetical protein
MRLSQKILSAGQFGRQRLVLQDFRMHADHQHFFVIRTVENPDPPALRQATIGAPEKIMRQFRAARLLKTENLTSLRIQSGHDVFDGAVLAGRIHGLKNNEQRMASIRIKQSLARVHLFHMFFQHFFIVSFRLIKRSDLGRPLSQPDLFALFDQIFLRADFHVLIVNPDWAGSNGKSTSLFAV